MVIAERTKVCANPNCHAAGKPQPWSNFYAKTKWDDGTMRQPHSQCKECRHANFRNRYQKHPDRHRGYRKAYYVRNTEDEKARCKARRERVQADPEEHAILLEQRRRRYREVHNVPRERWRAADGKPAQERTGESLDPAPFAEWLRYVMVRDRVDRRALAVAVGVSERTVYAVLAATRVSVDLATVEAALCRDGSRSLQDLYPEAMAVPGQNGGLDA